MPSNSVTILSNQSHPQDSSTQTLSSDKYKGDGYYSRSDGLHTVQFNLDDFTGTIVIEGTLAIDPQSSDWFSVELFTNTSVAGTVDTTGAVSTGNVVTLSSLSYVSETSNNNYNFTGNYIWVRAKITNWTDGTVNSILLNH